MTVLQWRSTSGSTSKSHGWLRISGHAFEPGILPSSQMTENSTTLFLPELQRGIKAAKAAHKRKVEDQSCQQHPAAGAAGATEHHQLQSLHTHHYHHWLRNSIISVPAMRQSLHTQLHGHHRPPFTAHSHSRNTRGLMYKDLRGFPTETLEYRKRCKHKNIQMYQCVHTYPSTFPLYIPINMELSTYVGVLEPSLSMPPFKYANHI